MPKLKLDKVDLDRELDTRESTTRTRSWVKPDVLPNPDPQDGYGYRWIRISMRGADDPMNVSSKIREGWEPVKAKDHPEIELFSVESERFADNIVMGGLMLCKAPIELINERNEYYQDQTAAQMRSVDQNLMRQSDPRMPLYSDKTTEVKFGGKN